MSNKHLEEEDVSSESEEGDDYDEDMHDPGLKDPEVVTKYKLAGEMANREFFSFFLCFRLLCVVCVVSCVGKRWEVIGE